MQQVAALHLLAVFLKPDFPVLVHGAPALGQMREDAGDFALLGYSPQPNMGGVGQRDHHGHAAPEAEQVKLLAGRTEWAGADILNRPNALVGIDDFIADLEAHTGSPRNHRSRVLTRGDSNVNKSYAVSCLLSSVSV